jgi:hypothetical protein
MGGVCFVVAFKIIQSDCTPVVSVWAALPFAFSTFLCGLGAAVESYLIGVGKPYETDTVPLPMAIRRAVIPMVTASKLVFVLTICLGENNPAIMNGSIYVALLFAALASPMEFFSLPYTEPFTKAVVLTRLFVIIVYGPTYGGLPSRIVLFLAEYIPLHCVRNIDHHTAEGSAIFHVMNALSYFFLYLVIDMVNIDSQHPCYSQVLEQEMSFPYLFSIIVIGGGLLLGIKLNEKRDQEGYEEIDEEDGVEHNERSLGRTSKPFPGIWT